VSKIDKPPTLESKSDNFGLSSLQQEPYSFFCLFFPLSCEKDKRQMQHVLSIFLEHVSLLAVRLIIGCTPAPVVHHSQVIRQVFSARQRFVNTRQFLSIPSHRISMEG